MSIPALDTVLCVLACHSHMQVKLTGDKKTSKESYKTPVIKGQANPRWFGDNKFTLYDVTSRVSGRFFFKTL